MALADRAQNAYGGLRDFGTDTVTPQYANAQGAR